MKRLDLIKQNATFVEQVAPDLIEELSQGQQPGCFVIACSDSRVSPSVITQAPLGSMFVHRNIANQVAADDASLTAGLYYAIKKLGVKKIVVKGHTGCGGIAAAVGGEPPVPELEGWLSGIRQSLAPTLAAKNDLSADELARANVLEQVRRLQEHPVYKAHGQGVAIEGYLYHLGSGRLELVTRVEPGGERHVGSRGAGGTDEAHEAH